VSLHVNHRPKTFAEVLGQDHVCRSLERVVKDRKAHAFIFTGPSGCGKTTLARIVANTVADNQATVANIEEFDAATNSGADAIRAVVSRTVFRAIGRSPIRAIIVDEAHRLSAAAWAVLLKPVEEPPSHVYWMFCTTEPSKIPKTIKTRCVSYDLKEVSEELIFGLLCKVVKDEKLEISEDILEAIAEDCGGSPRQALVFLETCKFSESVQEAKQLMRSAGRSKEILDLCRLLVATQKSSWTDAIKIIKNLEEQNTDAESARIVVVNYMASVLLNTKSPEKA